MSRGLFIFILILGGYIAVMLNLNSKVKLTESKRYAFPEDKCEVLKEISNVGLKIWIAVVSLLFVLLTIGIIYADELFPR